MLIILKSSIKELAKINDQENSRILFNLYTYLKTKSRIWYGVDIYIISFNLSKMI
jgi:hypothetical protein